MRVLISDHIQAQLKNLMKILTFIIFILQFRFFFALIFLVYKSKNMLINSKFDGKVNKI